MLVELLGRRILDFAASASTGVHPALWVSQWSASLARAVSAGDSVAVSVACDLIVRDPMQLPYGKLIKSSLARSLKRQAAMLDPQQRQQVLQTTARLLDLPYAPRELEDYAKLVGRFPRAEVGAMLVQVDPKNPKARHILGVLCGGSNYRVSDHIT